MPFFRHFWAENGHFQDKKPINQLVLEQFDRISALQITWYFSIMGLHVGIPKQNMFGPKMPFFNQSKKAYFWGFGGLVCGLQRTFWRKTSYLIYSFINKYIGMIRCEKNNIWWFCPCILHFNWHLVIQFLWWYAYCIPDVKYPIDYSQEPCMSSYTPWRRLWRHLGDGVLLRKLENLKLKKSFYFCSPWKK